MSSGLFFAIHAGPEEVSCFNTPVSGVVRVPSGGATHLLLLGVRPPDDWSLVSIDTNALEPLCLTHVSGGLFFYTANGKIKKIVYNIQT